MIPTDEATFIALWEAGTEAAEMARLMGIPKGTVGSRASALVRQGKIQRRPRGGSYPTQRALARQESKGVSTRVPPDTPQRARGVSRRVSPDTPQVQVLPPSQDDLRPLLTDILVELRQLTGALAVRVSTDTQRVHLDTPEVSARVSSRTPLPAERGKSVRWNLHLSERLRDQIKGLATARGLQDSQLVEALLWLALSLEEGR